jgi:hypothetical protein
MVWLSNEAGDSTCSQATDSATTNAHGQFSVPPRRRRLWGWYFGDPGYLYYVCAGHRSRTRLAYAASALGEYPPAVDSLTCLGTADGSEIRCRRTGIGR